MPADVDLETAFERSRKGPRYLMLGRLVLMIINLTSTVTVARLVSPHEYGLAAMALVVLTFAQTFRDMGVTQAALRKGHITPSELTLIFWLTISSTSIVTLIIVASSPLVAAYFDEPVVRWLLILACLGFFLSGATLQHRVLLERELRFGAVAISDIAGAVLGFGAALTLALARGDAWAIVASSVVQAFVSSAVVVAFSRWRPGRPRRDPHLGELIRFGANATVYSTSILASNQAATVVIGASMGPSALGQYNRAQTIYAMPASNLVQPFARATMPLLIKLRKDPERYRQAYIGLVQRLCTFLIPLSIVLCFVSPSLVEVLLGPAWHTAGYVLLALSPSLAMMGLAFAVNDILITQDRSSTLRNLGILEAVIRITAVIVGAQLGVVQTAVAFSAATALVTVIRIVVAGRNPPVSAVDQLRAAPPGLLVGVGAAAAGGIALLCGAYRLDGITFLVVQSLVMAAGALLAGLTWSRSRSALRELADIVGLKMPRRRDRSSKHRD